MQLYRKYRLWRPTAFECDMRCELIEPTLLIRFLQPGPVRCSAQRGCALIPSLPVPHHFSHALKPRWDASDRTFALIKA
ncbi:hypothetical protein N7516_003686 [Penicillium verrucosum]|uniref:uncharacterized protein n=1 Tax=Penicillium verrucosum TaxID=60171 RepID=UPI0025455A70|nr:uncharacterized protein N7516_003686 [Penicillium verrucosum]KAJ5943518.1 hypothetical protein N7516_003686 [Penicillium verrucosum]